MEWALRELIRDDLLEIKEGGKLWAIRELYWQCQRVFQENQKQEAALQTSSEHTENPQKKPEENHVTQKEFLYQFFGSFARDFGNPKRKFTNNHQTYFLLVPAFISVQPMKSKSKPLGIEKVFFDFDYCKKSEELDEKEILRRKAELKDEVKYFLNQLGSRNIKPLVIQTRRGYHIHVFFDSVYEIDKTLGLSKQAYKQLQLGLLQDHNYRFLDKVVVGDINRMCRIPFSTHEKSGEECIVVDNKLEPDKVRSIE